MSMTEGVEILFATKVYYDYFSDFYQIKSFSLMTDNPQNMSALIQLGSVCGGGKLNYIIPGRGLILSECNQIFTPL